MSMKNFMLSWLEHGTSFITSGPDCSFLVSDVYLGDPVALCVKCWPTRVRLPEAEIFSIVNEAPLHIAFNYYPPNVLIWLKYCWKGRTCIIKNYQSIYPSIKCSPKQFWNHILNSNFQRKKNDTASVRTSTYDSLTCITRYPKTNCKDTLLNLNPILPFSSVYSDIHFTKSENIHLCIFVH